MGAFGSVPVTLLIVLFFMADDHVKDLNTKSLLDVNMFWRSMLTMRLLGPSRILVQNI